MPTGLAKAKHISRIISAMRHVEKKIERQFIQERIQRERRHSLELKHGDVRTVPALSDKKKQAFPLTPIREKKSLYRPTVPPQKEKKDKSPLQIEREEECMRGDQIPTGGLITLAVRSALIEEGVPPCMLPSIKIDPDINSCGSYSASKNLIKIKKPMIWNIRDHATLSINRIRQKIKFAMADFGSTLIHEARHFEQCWKGAVYEHSTPERRMGLPRDYKKFFIEDLDDVSEHEKIEGCRIKKKLEDLLVDETEDLANMFEELNEKPKSRQERLKPMGYTEWKGQLFRNTRGSEFKEGFQKAWEIVFSRQYRQQHASSVAKAGLEKKSMYDLKAFKKALCDSKREQEKWVDGSLRKVYNEYKAFFEIRSKGKYFSENKLNTVIALTRHVYPHKICYLDNLNETDAHYVQYCLLKQYLTPSELVCYLEVHDCLIAYNYIRGQMLNRNLNHRALPVLDL